jgi:hypothetical protein
LINVTIAENFASGGSDPYDGYNPGPIASIYGGATLVNTILSCDPDQMNSATQAYWSLPLIDGGHNISSDGSANFTAPTSWNNADPRLAPLADNGGPTLTMALLPDSPAIDAGDNALAPATDQRGVPRPIGAASDIGAFELEPKLTLTRGPAGEVRLEYVFQPGQTNAVSASSDLATWLNLGTGVTDATGRFTLEDAEAKDIPTRFYKVEGQP